VGAARASVTNGLRLFLVGGQHGREVADRTRTLRSQSTLQVGEKTRADAYSAPSPRAEERSNGRS
jgi:hypothetical protein